jgi:hypothetical protein
MFFTGDHDMNDQEKQAEKQDFLFALAQEQSKEVYEAIANEGYGMHEFMYVLSIMLVGSGEALGVSFEDIVGGVVAAMPLSPENLTTQ